MNKAEAVEAVGVMQKVFALACPDSASIDAFNVIAERVKQVLRGKTNSDETKQVPQAFENYIREHPDVRHALVRFAFGMLQEGKRVSGKKLIEDMRADKDVCTYGILDNRWSPYVSRWLVHYFPEVEWGFEFSSVGFLCPWEDGYDEWMASDETDLEIWRKQR